MQPFLKDVLKLQSQQTEPLWKGPCDSGPNGGVTQGAISRFLVCRERFRIFMVKGLRPAERWNNKLGYGNMWHTCEEALARDAGLGWQDSLSDHVARECHKFPIQSHEILHWYNVCCVQFPIYCGYWLQHPDVANRTPLMQEKEFNVPYLLPSGRTVYLRGRWDSVDQVNDEIWLQENKSKGTVNEQVILRQLLYDLQTMLYLTALSIYQVMPGQYRLSNRGMPRGFPVRGVRYNVIRRPLSGGKGTIVRHKATKNHPEETEQHYYQRLHDIIATDPSEFFFRWKVEITIADIANFRTQCLDPILDSMVDWYEHITHPASSKCGIHWRAPNGIFNPLTDGNGSSDVDAYLESGGLAGLSRATCVYPELEE